MLKRHWGLLATAAVFAAGSASAQQSVEQVDKLQDQIQAMQREISDLKMKMLKTQKDAYAAAPAPSAAPAVKPPTAIVKMTPNNAPSICTPDELNCIALTSRLHLDVGGYNWRPATPSTAIQSMDDGINIRRARIGVLGTFQGDWNYALIYDFGGSSDGFGGNAPGSLTGGGTSGIENAYLSYTGFKGLAIEGGVTDVYYTLDEANGSNNIMFMERASSQVIAASIAAGDFRTFGGIRAYNDYAWLGVFATGPMTGQIHSDTLSTSQGIINNPRSEQFGSTARLTYQLLQGADYSLHIGGDAEFLFDPPVGPATATTPGVRTLTLSDRPELRIDPDSLLTTGAIANVTGAQVWSAEAAASWGPLFAQGEYFWYQIDRGNATTPSTAAAPNIPGGLQGLHFSGGYAQVGWTITGETRPYVPATGAYGTITPKNPVAPGSSGWGAWELAGRYSVVNLNDAIGQAAGIAGGQQTIYTAGLNWYVNRNIRFMLNYLHGTIEKQASPLSTINTGANFDAVAGRMQIAF